MLLSKGSDAPLALRALFRQCVEMAPSILVIDPLTTLAARNSSRQIDFSPMDETFLSELCRMLEEAKERGVTMIGVTLDPSMIQKRVLQCFDEQVRFSIFLFDSFSGRVRYSQSARSLALLRPSRPILCRIRRFAAVGSLASELRRLSGFAKPLLFLE